MSAAYALNCYILCCLFMCIFSYFLKIFSFSIFDIMFSLIILIGGELLYLKQRYKND